MTTVEMHIEFKVFLDKIESLQYDEFLSEEIDLILNRSMDILVENLYKAKAFDQLQELLQLDTSATLSTFYNVDPFTIVDMGRKAYYYTPTFYTGSPIYLYPANARVYVTRTAFPVVAEPEYKTCDRISMEMVEKFVVDLYNKPVFKNPKSLFFNDKFIVLLDYYTSLNASSDTLQHSYYRKPVRMVNGSVNCELNDNLHRKIVDIAINLALEEIESPRLETNTAQLNDKI